MPDGSNLIIGQNNTGDATTKLTRNGAVANDAFMVENQNGLGIVGVGSGASSGVTGQSPTGTGVIGTSTSGIGVRAVSSTSIGLEAVSASGIGAQGNSTSSTGVEGNSTSGIGVSGTSQNWIGVSGRSVNDIGVSGSGKTIGAAGTGANSGVYGASGAGTGIYGLSWSSDGVYGISDKGTGVHGRSDRWGVYGESPAGLGMFGESSSYIGIYGRCTGSVGIWGSSSRSIGVVGTGSEGEGVWGISSARFGVRGNGPVGVMGISPGGRGVAGQSTTGRGVVGISRDNIGVYAETSASVPSGQPQPAALYANARGTSGWAAFFNGGVLCFSSLFVVGGKYAAIPFPDGSHRVLHAVESPEAWFEDFGRARLVRGRARVSLDRQFAAVTTGDYHVFLTPEADTRGLYVRRRDRRGFEVRETGDGAGTLTFTYRIVARRRDLRVRRFEKVRLPRVRDLPREERVPTGTSEEALPTPPGPKERPAVPPELRLRLPKIPRASSRVGKRRARRRNR